MNKTREYLQHAEECIVLARRAHKAEHREGLLDIAKAWADMAAASEKKLGRMKETA